MIKIDQEYFFLKVSKKEFIEKLFSNGSMYCNTFDYFTKIDNPEQRDIYETTFDLRQGTLTKLTITDKDGKKRSFRPNINSTLRELHTGNIGNMFCLYALKYTDYLNKGLINLPKEMYEFGDTCLLILDVHSFLERIRLRLDELNRSFEKGFVRYSDFKSYNGLRTPFDKDNRFLHQSEYRIYIKPKQDELIEPLQFEIGNISDISIMCPFERFDLKVYDRNI